MPLPVCPAVSGHSPPAPLSSPFPQQLFISPSTWVPVMVAWSGVEPYHPAWGESSPEVGGGLIISVVDQTAAAAAVLIVGRLGGSVHLERRQQGGVRGVEMEHWWQLCWEPCPSSHVFSHKVEGQGGAPSRCRTQAQAPDPKPQLTWCQSFLPAPAHHASCSQQCPCSWAPNCTIIPGPSCACCSGGAPASNSSCPWWYHSPCLLALVWMLSASPPPTLVLQDPVAASQWPSYGAQSQCSSSHHLDPLGASHLPVSAWELGSLSWGPGLRVPG